MDTNKAQLNPFDVYFKQTIAYFKTHIWSLVGLFLLSMFLSGFLLVLMLLPITVFGVLSINARGMTLDLYLGLGILFLFLLILVLTYIASVFVKSYYLVIDESTSAIHAFEKSFATSFGVFKTVFLRNAVGWGYILFLSMFVTVISVLSYRAGTPLLVLSLLILLPIFMVSLVVLIYFKFAEYVSLGQGITGINALAESFRLVKGNFLGIFGRSLILSVVIMGISMLFSVLIMPLSMMGTFSDTANILSIFVRMIVNVLTQFITAMLTFAFLYSMYKDIVVKKPRPEAYNPSGKPLLYVFATLGFVLLIGGLAALGIGGKFFIEKDGLRQFDKYLRQFEDTLNTSSKSINQKNINIENNFNLETTMPPTME